MKCADKCKEIGKTWRAAEDTRQKSLSVAIKRKKELVAEAGRLRKEVEDRIQSLGTQIQGSELKVSALEKQLEDVERRERGRIVKPAGKGGSPMSALAGLAKQRVEELRENLVEVRTQRDEGRERIAELEGILTTFKEEYNPNFNDEGVKRAVRSWEEYAARDKSELGNEAHDRDLDEIEKPDTPTEGINWAEWEKTEESDIDVRKSCLVQLAPLIPLAATT